MNPTDSFVKFLSKVEYSNLPEVVIEVTKKAFLNSVGVMLAGSQQPAGKIAIQLVKHWGGNPISTVATANFRTSPPEAAFANAIMAHILSFCDSNHPLYGHPSGILIPTIFCLSEMRRASGKNAILAFVVGIECAVRLSRVINLSHYNKGWHATSTLGVLGAAAAASKILEISPERMKAALGIAASASSGLRQNLGSMTRAFHAGNAARNGVTAVLLAQEGFTSDADSLEGAFGLFCVMAGDEIPRLDVWKEINTSVDKPLEITLPMGLTSKKHPSCGAVSPAVEGILRIVSQHRINEEDVERIDVGVTELVKEILIYHDPKSIEQGQFSLEYCVAVTVIDKCFGLDQLDPRKLNDPRVRNLMKTIHMIVISQHDLETKFNTTVEVKCIDGRAFREEMSANGGTPFLQLSMDQVLEKYYLCASRAFNDKKRVDDLAEALTNLDTINDMNEITKLIA
jgi:2-methylcitrate dehydratase PrpD